METCHHFPICGGCTFQGLTPEDEQSRKEALFLDAVAGKNLKMGEFFQVPLKSRRRATFTARRTKKSTQVGFMEVHTHNVIDLEECHIVTPKLLGIKRFLEIITPKIASRSALLKAHITQCDNGFDIVIENAKEMTPPLREEIAGLCPQFQIRRLQFDHDPVYKDDDPFVIMEDKAVIIPPRPFLQASIECENKLREWVNDALKPCHKIADLFSGIGTFSYALNAEVSAYEGLKPLSDIMQANLNRLQLHHIKAFQRDLFREPLQAKELNEFDGVVIDPPRAGASSQCDELAKSNVSRIAYVSCNPATFARDAQILMNGGYQTDAVNLLDQFRYSDHLELFALFTKSA